MAHPQIAVFARLANGNPKVTRSIAGQNTMFTRSIHGMAYDPVSDEIVVPQFYAQAVLTYRGGANGDEAPIRVIHGPDTQLKLTHNLDVDPVHREIIVPVIGGILVFPSDANGNVAPIRVLKGPDTLLDEDSLLPPAVAVDPIHNLLIVVGKRIEGSDGNGKSGSSLLIFHRTDSGNVKPRAIISGLKTQIRGVKTIVVYPPREIFLATIGGTIGGNERYSPVDFVGVWGEHDNGDVPPRWTIGGPNGMLRDAKGLAIDPKSQSVFVTDKYLNSILTYHFPEIF